MTTGHTISTELSLQAVQKIKLGHLLTCDTHAQEGEIFHVN